MIKKNENMSPHASRLCDAIAWTGLSANAFAREVGLPRSENLYQVLRGKYKLTQDIVNKIVTRYDNLSPKWLLYGEGDMLFNDKMGSPSLFPYFAKDITLFNPWEDLVSCDAYITMPMSKGTEFAALSMSEAMQPEVPKGAILLFQSTDLDSIIPGKIYYVVCERFKGVRYIRTSKDEKYINLTPCNTVSYDTISIKPKEIRRIFEVRAIIIDKTM